LREDGPRLETTFRRQALLLNFEIRSYTAAQNKVAPQFDHSSLISKKCEKKIRDVRPKTRARKPRLRKRISTSRALPTHHLPPQLPPRRNLYTTLPPRLSNRPPSLARKRHLPRRRPNLPRPPPCARANRRGRDHQPAILVAGSPQMDCGLSSGEGQFAGEVLG
jgi:hypothetical protein